MAAEFMIYFKSLSGDILSLPFSPEKSIEQFRDEIAQQVSLEQDDEIGSDRIIIFHKDPDVDDSIIPILEQENTYNYFIREDQANQYYVRLDTDTHAFDITQNPEEQETYYKYDLQILKDRPFPLIPQLVQTFSFYYNEHRRLFYHQDHIEIVRPAEGYYDQVGIRLLGDHLEIGMSLTALVYRHLDIPWFNRNDVAQSVEMEWHDLSTLYAHSDEGDEENHYRDQYEEYEDQDRPFDSWRDYALDPRAW